MEINITRFFNEAYPRDYSASVAEIGKDAGITTWSAACNDSAQFMLLDDEEKRESARAFFKGFGAWNEEEIAAWNDVELNALLIQFIAGDMRESGLHSGMSDDEWREYQKGAEAGMFSSRIFGGPLSIDGQVYFYMGE